MTKLYEIPRNSKIYESVAIDGKTVKDSWVKFMHLDGMYSYCEAYNKEGDLLMESKNGQVAVVHLSASTPLVAYKDGYKIGKN